MGARYPMTILGEVMAKETSYLQEFTEDREAGTRGKMKTGLKLKFAAAC